MRKKAPHPFHKRRTAVGVVTAMMAGGLLVGGPPAAAAAPPTVAPASPRCDASAASTAAARVMAARCDRRVEDVSAMTETERSFVNPDGTQTAEISAVPTRVRLADGSFTAVDTTLRQVGDAVAPVATTAEIRLSGGGDGELFSVETDGRGVAWTWPAKLPTPTLAGNVATYANVPVKDVDLQVRVSREGASTAFVVKTRAAALDPALRRLAFGLRTTGLTARTGATGEVSWVDKSGAAVLTTGKATAWDSAEGSAAQKRTAVAAGDTADGRWSPFRAAKRSALDVVVDRDEVRLGVDPAFLADPSTTLPLVIDPVVGRSNWAMINNRYPNQCYVMCNGHDNDDHMKVGWTTDDGGMWYRSMVSFNSSSFEGKHVLDAKLRSRLVYSWNLVGGACTATGTWAHAVGAFSASTTWNNHASWPAALASSANQENCDQAGGVYSEWGHADLTAHVYSKAASGSTVYLGLRAKNDSTSSWKKYDENDTKLHVTYNSFPTAPTSASTHNDANAASRGCSTDEAAPTWLRSSTPTVKAKPNDPDGSAETDLRIRFTFQAWNGSAWTAWQQVSSSTNLTVSTAGQFTVPASWGPQSKVRWHAETLDPWSFGGTSGTDNSTASAWCYYAVDPDAPLTPPGVSSQTYPEFAPGVDEDWHGGIGRTADFTFTSGGVPDVAGWMWGWADPPLTYVAAPAPGADLTLPITPPPPYRGEIMRGGELTLHVRSVDGTGVADGTNSLRKYKIKINGSSDAVAEWKMDEGGGMTYKDTNQVGQQNPLTLSATIPRTFGRVIKGPDAAGFNGFSTASTSVPVVDTSRSFSVSAWVKPGAMDNGYRTVVSANGTNISAFMLRRDSSNRWTFTTTQADSPTTAPVHTNLSGPAIGRLNKWTHLVGVYDQAGNQSRLYVDGSLVASATATAPFKATGPVIVGRDRWAGSATFHEPWFGPIADVKIWDRVVTVEQIAAMSASEVGRWSLDGHGFDDSGFGNDLTETGAMSYVSGHNGDAVSFDGSAKFLAAAGPVLRTDQSYTVSAYAKLAPLALTNPVAAAVTVDGNNNSAFNLRYSGAADKWVMVTQGADTSGTYSILQDPATTAAGVWAQVTAVVDRSANQVRLYVNGQLKATGTPAEPGFAANGQLVIGRERYNGINSSYFAGEIDDVRVFQGVLPPSKIAEMYQP